MTARETDRLGRAAARATKTMKWWVSRVLIGVLALVLGSLNVSARNLTDADIHQYMAKPIFENLWFGLYGADGQKYGWWNGNEYRKDDYWVFEEKSEIWMLDRIEVDGQTHEEKIIIQNHTKEYFDINNGFVLRKIETQTNFGTESRTTVAIVADNKVHVRVDHGDQSSSFDVEGFSLSLHDVYALELLLQKYPDWEVGDKINYNYYDPDTFQTSTETDVIMEIGRTFQGGLPIDYYRVKTLSSTSRTSFEALLTNKGVPLKYIEAAGYAVIEDEKVVKEGVSFGGANFEESVIYLDQSIPNAKSLSRMKIEIVGNYEGGIHSGYQQEVVFENPGVYLILGNNIGEPEKGTSAEKKDNLAESASYPLGNVDVQRMVQDALGGSRTAWDKVKTLVAYVDRFIADDYSSNSLSVFEIIQKRRGDCSEHALLFNTMARAAGIPARVVRCLMHFEDKKFGLHAWNEVLVDGVWRAVDATWNQTEIPITHIKFSENHLISPNISFNLIWME